MLDFEFISPTKFVFGKNAETRTGEFAAKYGKKALVHYGGGSAIKSGLIKRVVESLNKAGVQTVELGGVQPNPRDTLIYKGIEFCKKENVELIIAVGGGSVIDSSKAIAVGVKYNGDFWDLYSGKQPTAKLPVGVVLTIPAAGSEGSVGSVVTKEEGQLKRSCDYDIMRPEFAIMNPELSFTLPPFQTACGAADIMAHVMERYFTNTSGVDFTDRLCEATLQTIIRNVRIVMKNPTDYDARANIMWAGMVAHNDIMGVGREQDWSSHLLEHELSGLYDVAHGAGLAVIFPAFLWYQCQYKPTRIAQFAVRVFGTSMDFEHPEYTAVEGINKLRAFFRELGLPTTFQELGAKESDIDILVKKCNFNHGDKLGYFNPLTRKQAAEVYKLACKPK
jgi:alcohol dehydrogenase YqhD (iron-dependent ADH family)